MKPISAKSPRFSFAFVLTAILTTSVLSAYTYKKRELTVRTTAYTHNENDHIIYGRKSALGSKLKFTPEYSSAAADWSRFPVGTEFRIKGVNRHFVVDDYGSALLGTDTIDIYFPSRQKMNRWGVQMVDIVITKYGDFEKSREILLQRKHYDHCLEMFTKIEENELNSLHKKEVYEAVPEVPAEINPKLMVAASIPKNEWKDPAPQLLPDIRQPVTEKRSRFIPTREVMATSQSPPFKWRLFRKQRSGQITVPLENATSEESRNSHSTTREPGEYKPIRKVRVFRPILSKS